MVEETRVCQGVHLHLRSVQVYIPGCARNTRPPMKKQQEKNK